MPPQVVVYSRPQCDACDIVKRYFMLKNIVYIEKDVASDTVAAAESQQKAQTKSVPVIEIAGKVVVGFNQKLIDDALVGAGITQS